MGKGPISAMDEQAAKRDLEQVVHMVDQGDTFAVIPRLEQIMTRYPQSRSAMEARYWLGITHFKLGSYRSAANSLEEYQHLAPEGVHRAECQKILAQMADFYSKEYGSKEEMDARIQSLKKEIETKPDDIASRMTLANLLWIRGEYAQTATLYEALVTQYPDKKNDGIIASRMEFKPDGSYTVLTPAELQRRQALAQPLVVVNTSSFRSGRDSFTQQNRYYAVTGQAVNRGEDVLYGVEVGITLYGFGNVVFDTRTVNIGRLNPGEIRAFSTRFDNFENVENINRYECVGTFQR